MQTFAAARSAFLVCVLWIDLMFDVQVRGHDGDSIPASALASIGVFLAISLFTAFMAASLSVPLIVTRAFASEGQSNLTCPASRLLPALDADYHQCSHGFENHSCERFVQTLEQLLPKYDCQRSFDNGAGAVPAVWLAGDAELEDYVHLLWRLSSSTDKMFAGKPFSKATNGAKKLFSSKEFRSILDGALAEDYMARSKQLERKLKH
jgi:hypothetical protein